MRVIGWIVGIGALFLLALAAFRRFSIAAPTYTNAPLPASGSGVMAGQTIVLKAPGYDINGNRLPPGVHAAVPVGSIVRYASGGGTSTAGGAGALPGAGRTIGGAVGNAILPGAGAFTGAVGGQIGANVAGAFTHPTPSNVLGTIFPVAAVNQILPFGIGNAISSGVDTVGNAIGDAFSSINPF